MTPLQELLDLLTRRHALPVILFLAGGSQPFGALVAHESANPAQITQRLKELREAGLVEVDEAGDYRLTSFGRRLLGGLQQLEKLAADWAALTPRQRHPRGAATSGRGE